MKLIIFIYFLLIMSCGSNTQECKIILNSMSMESHYCYEDSSKFIFEEVTVNIKTTDSFLINKKHFEVVLGKDTLVFRKADNSKGSIIDARMIKSNKGVVFEKEYKDVIHDISNGFYVDDNRINTNCNDSIVLSFLYRNKSIYYIFNDKKIKKYEQLDSNVICE